MQTRNESNRSNRMDWFLLITAIPLILWWVLG